RSFVVENRPEATGNIALEAVVCAAPDGYMLSVCGSTELRNEIIYTDLKFSFMRDTTPVASICRAPLVVVVHPSFSARSVPELIPAAKAMPDSISAKLAAGTSVEVWFRDEMRVGQKNKLTYRWARKGSRPRRGAGAALVLPACNCEAMQLHLDEIATKVA